MYAFYNKQYFSYSIDSREMSVYISQKIYTSMVLHFYSW